MSEYEKIVYASMPSRMAHRTGEICKFISDKGYLSYHPFQAMPYELYEGHPKVGRRKTMQVCLKEIRDKDEFWLFGVSEGTLEELVYAQSQGKPIQYHFKEFDNEWEQFYDKLSNKFGDPLNPPKRPSLFLTDAELGKKKMELIIVAFGYNTKKFLGMRFHPKNYGPIGIDELATELVPLLREIGFSAANHEEAKELIRKHKNSYLYYCGDYYYCKLEEVTDWFSGAKKLRLKR